MIKNLEIKNFKSIKNLRLDCKKINIFIGKPNTGKSNILESVGLLSFPFVRLLPNKSILKKLLRFADLSNLFYDNDLTEAIKIIADNIIFEMKYEKGGFIGSCEDKETKEIKFNFNLDYSGYDISPVSINVSEIDSSIKFYRFESLDTFDRLEAEYLLPPGGYNLLQILLTNKSLRKIVSDLFSDYELIVVLKPQEKKIEIQKSREGIIISYPYQIISDTLQRIVFHITAIETNKNSIIIFEEPESHAFPYYTKFLAECIALDKTNQYFISTHNPYLLLSLLEKSNKKDIGIFITYFKNFQTKLKAIKEKEIAKIFDLNSNIFFNLEEFLEKL